MITEIEREFIGIDWDARSCVAVVLQGKLKLPFAPFGAFYTISHIHKTDNLSLLFAILESWSYHPDSVLPHVGCRDEKDYTDVVQELIKHKSLTVHDLKLLDHPLRLTKDVVTPFQNRKGENVHRLAQDEANVDRQAVNELQQEIRQAADNNLEATALARAFLLAISTAEKHMLNLYKSRGEYIQANKAIAQRNHTIGLFVPN